MATAMDLLNNWPTGEHMRPQVTARQLWLVADMPSEPRIMPLADFLAENPDAADAFHITLAKKPERPAQDGAEPAGIEFEDDSLPLLESMLGGTVYEAHIRDAYGARMSADGYLDCTDWALFDTKEDAATFLLLQYLPDIDPGRVRADGPMVASARDLYAQEGSIEIDEDAMASPTEEGGAWVQAWVFVPYTLDGPEA